MNEMPRAPVPGLYVGAGGWHYFLVPSDRLVSYSKCFKFVEVNSSFYAYPTLRAAYGWRKRVPEDFVFAVRANREITHGRKLLLCEETVKAQEYMKRLCEALRSEALVYTMPPSFEPSEENLARAREFFNEAERGRFKLAFETRGRLWGSASAREALRKVLAEADVTHSVDISYQEPVYANDLVYARIFGPARETTGRNQYSLRGDQMDKVVRKAGEHLRGGKRVMVAFHTVKMYEDAARMVRKAKTAGQACG
ncbi:MAG: DUF72 domain-containing protein [Candidatus Brockarchaeota archaeon]|nr:DUF72 domain-containing protein [Candidatus Brockarchaeota archaeon]